MGSLMRRGDNDSLRPRLGVEKLLLGLTMFYVILVSIKLSRGIPPKKKTDQ
jgi:hypothetical protein